SRSCGRDRACRSNAGTTPFAPGRGKSLPRRKSRLGGEEFLPRKQSYRLARNGAATRRRTCRPRFTRYHVRGKNRRAVEEWRSTARRSKREPIFGTVDSIYAAAGGV